MTNLLLTVSILVTTNWTEVDSPRSPNGQLQIIEVGRLQTNYIVSTAHPIHPAFKAEPAYGPWEFARTVPVPAAFTFDTNIFRRAAPMTNIHYWTNLGSDWTNPGPASEVAPPPHGITIRGPARP